MLLALALSTLLSQTDASATAAVPTDPAVRAAEAAARAADAAVKAAEAAERIANVVAPKAPTTAAAAAAPAEEKWKGSVGLGLTFITGNSQTLTFTGTAAADRKWDAWSFGIRLNGAYGLANPDTNTVGSTSATTARRGAGSVRGDRQFGDSFAAIFALAGTEFDHMKNIESRSIGEIGAGLTFFNQKDQAGTYEKLFLRLDLAARGGYETRFQYFPVPAPVSQYGLIIFAPRIAASFRWAFSRDVRFSEEIEFIPFVLAPAAGRLLINNTTKLNARLTEALSLSTSFVLNYDSQPPEGAGGLKRKETDVALTVGVEAAF